MNCYKKTLTRLEILFCLSFFLIASYWAIIQPFNVSPDEAMRYAVPQFIFQHNRLPVGDELTSHWGFSYAHYPTVLYARFGYLFMKVFSLFTAEENMLLIAARMVSVFSGTGTVYFLLKASKQLFQSPVRWIFLFFIAAMPQFVFLSSYVNCDSVAIFATSIIFYSWILGMTEGWNYQNATLLAIGISVCALAYYNCYAWILFSIPFCLISCMIQHKNYVKSIKLITYAFVIVFLLISYSFIRHVVLYNDLLGFKTCAYYGELYAIDSLKPSIRMSYSESGIPFSQMLFNSDYNWCLISWRSFIGAFGYMTHFLPSIVYKVITGVVILSIFALTVKFISERKMQSRADTVLRWFYSCLAGIIIVTVFLSIIQSYYRDYQPQGRYCYPAMIPFAFAITKGYEYLLSKFKKKHCTIAVILICTAMMWSLVMAFWTAFLPSITMK